MRSSIILVLILVSSCKQVKSDWIDRSLHEGLYNLDYSESFETYSINKNPKNIKNTIGNLEEAKLYYDAIFKEDLSFAVLFVDNQNWDKYAYAPPPGMPQSFYGGNILLGLGKSVMASRWEQTLSQFSGSEIDTLKFHFGDSIDLDLFFRDGLSLHELAHLYQFVKIDDGMQRRWLSELFANLCQVGAAKNLSNNSVYYQMDVFQQLLIDKELWGDVQYRTLQDFEEHYFDIMKLGRNYGWYQTQFYVIAKQLHEKYGDDVLQNFRNLLIAIDPKKVSEIEDDKLELLIEQYLGKEALNIINWDHDS